MRTILCIAASVALAGCSQETAEAENSSVAAEAAVANDANASADAAGTALASINETTWEFTDPKTKKPIQESIDATGNYIANSGTEHVDHGTAVMKDGKACFTSAMDKEGEVCWTDPMVAEGQSGQTTNDKGETLTVKRTAYVPLAM